MTQSNSSSTVVTVDSELFSDSRSRLSQCLGKLQLSSVHEPSFSRDKPSQFAKKLDDVKEFVHGVIESEGLHSSSKDGKPALYVCGVPGIGKTTGVLWCCKEVIKEFSELNRYNDDGMIPTLCHINAGHLQSAADPSTYLQLQIEKAIKGKSKNGVLEARLKSGEVMVVVVMDEIENLISSSKKQQPPATGPERALKQLIDWAIDEDVHLALIGISNSTGDSKFGRLQLMHKFDVVTFGAYSADDLSSILEARMGPHVMEKKAIEFIAKTVAGTGGDARKALEIASKSVQLCFDQLPENSSSSATEQLVKMKHALMTIRAPAKQYHETIKGLPEEGKAALCVLSVLCKTDVTHTTFGTLRNFVSQCVDAGAMGELSSTGDFKLILETLENSSLLQFGDTTGKKKRVAEDAPLSELMFMPICLGTQATDIEKAVQDELGKTAFYATVMAKTRDNLNLFRAKSSQKGLHVN